MPTMPRPPGEGKKIAYKILGKPANMAPPSPERAKIDREILAKQTKRMK